jgi:hypothetical protein
LRRASGIAVSAAMAAKYRRDIGVMKLAGLGGTVAITDRICSAECTHY